MTTTAHTETLIQNFLVRVANRDRAAARVWAAGRTLTAARLEALQDRALDYTGIIYGPDVAATLGETGEIPADSVAVNSEACSGVAFFAEIAANMKEEYR